MKQENEIVAVDKPDMTPNQIVALAVEKNLDPGTLSKLLDVQERYEQMQAKKAYVKAMTAFKLEAPAVLLKDATVDFNSSKGRTHYKYADLGSIVRQITAMLGKHHLSASWTTAQDTGGITVACHITHEDGHSECVVLTAPADDSGNKNRIQSIGSTVTYLQRYTLLASLGMATAEQDDDGRSYGKDAPIHEPTMPTEEEVAYVDGVMRKMKMTGTARANLLTGQFQTADLASLTKAQVDDLLVILKDLWAKAPKVKKNVPAKSN